MTAGRWYKSRYLWLTSIMIVAIGGLGVWRFLVVKADKPVYLFGTVERGNIVTQVAATGTLAAVTTVQVGSQVSGNIAELYEDFNSTVKKGQLLAKLDQAMFMAQVEQAEANVRTAKMTLNNDMASIAAAEANLEKAKVDVLDKQRKLRRQRELFEQSLIARDDIDTAQAAYDASVATQKAAEAQLKSTQALYDADKERLLQSRASLQSAKLNLEHTVITSPISGTIISRSVDRGQTVAASMSAPTLFTIGEDLTKMQVNTAIDEADVGKIKPGMEAAFTVDAYPLENFKGTISQVRLAATTVNNIVTYNTIIDVANPLLELRPGMTANVKIIIEKVENTLKIPNAALRFRPSLSETDPEAAFTRSGKEGIGGSYAQVAPAQTSAAGNGRAEQGGNSGSLGRSGTGDGGQRNPGIDADIAMNRSPRVPVWTVAADGALIPVFAQLGLSDGVSTQVISGNLKQGDRIVTGMESESNHKTTSQTKTQAPGFGGPGMGGPPPPPQR